MQERSLIDCSLARSFDLRIPKHTALRLGTIAISTASHNQIHFGYIHVAIPF